MCATGAEALLRSLLYIRASATKVKLNRQTFRPARLQAGAGLARSRRGLMLAGASAALRLLPGRSGLNT